MLTLTSLSYPFVATGAYALLLCASDEKSVLGVGFNNYAAVSLEDGVDPLRYVPLAECFNIPAIPFLDESECVLFFPLDYTWYHLCSRYL